MTPATDWTSAIIILAAGLTLGALFVFFVKRRRVTSQSDADLQRRDLEARRDALLQQLRGVDLTPDERTRLELETAQVLRELDAHSPLPAARGQGQGEGSAAMNPTVKGFLWGASSVGALVVLFYLVSQSAAPRQEGGMLTGDINAPQQQPPQDDARLRQLEAAVQRDPNNLQLRNDLAQEYLERENLMAVFEQTKFVLEKSPNDSRALTFQGLVRMAMGEAETAMQMLQQATKSDATNLDAWVALAWVYAQNNRMKDAEATIDTAMRHSPENRERLTAVFAQMKQQIERGPSPSQQLPADHPPIDGAPPTGGGVRVTLSLDPSARTRSGVVFVIARNPAGGPPVAVKRVIATSFPTSVELTSADSMMGQPLPAVFRLEARLDSDGDPMTRPATDPSAMQNDVAPGAVVTLALK